MAGQRIVCEAAEGELIGLAVMEDPSASGGRCVGGFDEAGDRLKIRIQLEKAGLYMIVIRYKTLGGDKPNVLNLNGERILDYTFRNTAEWRDAIIGQFPFRAGENVFEIEHVWGWIAVDTVTFIGGAAGSVTSVQLFAENGATEGPADAPLALTALADHAAEFRFWARSGGGEWKPVNDWSSKHAVIWTPPAIGDYELKVTARNAGTEGEDGHAGAEAVLKYRVLPEYEGKPLVSPVFSNHMVLQRDKDVPIWGWSRPGDAVTVAFGDRRIEATADGNGRWEASLGVHPAGGPHTIRVIGPSDGCTFEDVYFGDVWLASGQSNMEWPLSQTMNAAEEIAAADEPLVRYIRYPMVPSAVPVSVPDPSQSWKPVNPQTAPEVSAVAWFFARKVHRETGVPIGILFAAAGGTKIETWMDEETMLAYPATSETTRRIRSGAEPVQMLSSPTVMYNGLIAPVVPYRLKGVIWYQGESNGGDPGYNQLLPMWMDNWRKRFRDPELPYIIIQLSAYGMRQTEDRPVQKDSGFAIVREAQLNTALADPHAALVVTTDIGDPDDIHPLNKQDVGERSALVALALHYGKRVAWSGPVFSGCEVEGSRVRIRFAHAESGLMAGTKEGLAPVEPARDGKLLGFALAGKDGVYHAAEALIDGDSVLLSADAVPEPVHVRYNWYDSPVGNLYNKAGLPAAPFRADCGSGK